MTVIREKKSIVISDFNHTTEIVKSALDFKELKYSYLLTEFIENTGNNIFEIKIVPRNKLYMSTRMTINIFLRDEDTTYILLKTKSQSFIMGDVFGFYNKLGR